MYTACARSWRIRFCMSRKSRIRVVARDVGGGFGMKGNVYPEEAIIIWGRPPESAGRSNGSRRAPRRCLVTLRARDQNVSAELGARRGRQIPGLALDRLAQCRRLYRGAPVRSPILFSLKLASTVYDIPAVAVTSSLVFTNYCADRSLSRCRPPRGRLPHGAPGRPGRRTRCASIQPSFARRT